MCGATLATLARIDPDDSIEFGELSSPLSDSFPWGCTIAHPFRRFRIAQSPWTIRNQKT